MVDGLDLNAMFGAALGLAQPWQVVSVTFDQDAGRLDLGLDFPRAARFACPEPGCAETACAVHDTVEKTWRHLDFFEHQAYLAARVPRVRCPQHGVHLVTVPWARPGSGFTLLFEVAMLTYAKQMPIAPLAKMAREHDTRIWRVIEHHVGTARAGMDFSEVTEVGMDETSARRGQDYVSIFMDLTERRVMFATGGRDATTVAAFAADLSAHGGDPATQIQRVCCDMSPAFIKGINTHLSSPAEEDADAAAGHRPRIVFDRYHVVAKANEAVDTVRRAEAHTRPELKRSRYAWLKNDANLTVKQREQLTWLTRPSMQLKTTRAARWRDDFNGFYDQPTPGDAEAYLRRWCYGAKRSRLDPIKDFVRLVEAHWDGIIAWQQSRLSNGLLEGTNSLIQAAKRRARGYRNKAKMITIIYLIAGRLPLPQIHTI
ncbi:MAG: ISL3 family transposase [Burkholderiales bacterium]|nr:ISL3 family transposase [Burkholderiales bacterium]